MGFICLDAVGRTRVEPLPTILMGREMFLEVIDPATVETLLMEGCPALVEACCHSPLGGCEDGGLFYDYDDAEERHRLGGGV